MADKKGKNILKDTTINRDGGVLYYYELTNGKTYVGRYQKDNLMSRAKDHFYNALVFAFPEQGLEAWYHSEDNSGEISQFTSTSPSRLEKTWGAIIRKNYNNKPDKAFNNFLFSFLQTNEMTDKEKDIKEEIKEINTKEDLQNFFKWNKNDIIFRRYHYKAIDQIDQREQRYGTLIHWDENINVTEIKNKASQSNFEDLFKNKIKTPNRQKVGIDFFSTKFFKVNEDYWTTSLKTNIDNKEMQSYNIITLINNLEPPDNLRNVNLGEFLLTAIDIASKNKIMDSLNDKIGDFKKVYNFYKDNYIVGYKDNNNYLIQNEMKKLLINTKKTQIEYHTKKAPTQTTVKDTNNQPITITVSNDIEQIIGYWISTHLGKAKQYWEIDETDKMLENNFKYFLQIYLPERKNIERISKQEEEYEYQKTIQTLNNMIKYFHEDI